MSQLDCLPAEAWRHIVRFMIEPVGVDVALLTVEFFEAYRAQRRSLSGVLTSGSDIRGVACAGWHGVLELDHRGRDGGSQCLVISLSVQSVMDDFLL